ncbi:MAG: acylneuraminate cytidylyltransferase family protein [bacterium]|nr:acylneuraminate cytidylyltransferase family protein [bacterium]
MEKKYNIVALLPMKYNSERVPGKNFKEFQGKPLVNWILDSLLDVPEIDRVIINTDAVDKLKSMGLGDSDKVLIRERPEEIRGDMVSMNKIIADDLENVSAKTYLMTHTTNPLISSETITNSIISYMDALKEGYDSLFSVNKFQSRFYNSNVEAVNHDPQNMIRTQDLDPLYEENSCLYLFSKESFGSTNARIGSKPKVYETPFFESVDIDDAETWKLAEVFQRFK